MKPVIVLALSTSLAFLCSCSYFQTGQSTPQPLAHPVGKNWQVIEEPPALTNERERPQFQTEQSVQPEGAKPVAPTGKRKVETPL